MTDFQEVYNLYFRDVYRYALSLCRNEALAEEITQETFFKALTKLNSFDGKCKISVWLCQIAKNTYLSLCRKNKHFEADADISVLIEDDCLEDRFCNRDTAFVIHRILHGLAEPYKEVFPCEPSVNCPSNRSPSYSGKQKPGHGSLITGQGSRLRRN